jgi:hypothetical protein
MRTSGGATFRELTDGMDVAKIFSPVGFDDHRGLRRRRIPLPEEELLTIALEADFYDHEVGGQRSEVGGTPSGERILGALDGL